MSSLEGKVAASSTGGEISGKVASENSSLVSQMITVRPADSPQKFKLETPTSFLHFMGDTVEVKDGVKYYPVLGFIAVEAGYHYTINTVDLPVLGLMKIE